MKIYNILSQLTCNITYNLNNYLPELAKDIIKINKTRQTKNKFVRYSLIFRNFLNTVLYKIMYRKKWKMVKVEQNAYRLN